MAVKPLRHVVVMLPGITGSVLQKDGRDVWAISGQAACQALRTLGRSLDELRLSGDDPGGIVADRVMPDAHIVPGLVKIDGYSAVSKMIRETFDIEPGSVHEKRPANFIEFPYDWRLDNRVSAEHLQALVRDRLERWREHSHNPNAQVIFVAHSMGGLVARYYLEVLGGWRECRGLITFGTPYRGSLKALDFLVHGYKKLFLDLTEVMRTFPSMYQLLPIYRVLRVRGDFVRVAEADAVPNIEPARALDGLAFHREIEEKVDEHRRDAEYLERGYALQPVVGTRQPTLQSAVLDQDGEVTVERTLPDWMDALLGDGDGTVPRASAIPIELSNAYRDSFATERHGSLQCNQSILEDVRGRLEQMQVTGLAEVRAPEESPAAAERPAIALDLDDLYVIDEPVTLRGQLVNVERSVGPLQARIEPVDAPQPTERTVEFALAPDGWRVEIEGLVPGLYRVEVRTTKGGPWAPPPVHDLFEVASAP
jgi:pimeloyl-ACP methyl ester carboxylesterase